MLETLECVNDLGFSKLKEDMLMLIDGGSYSKIDGGGNPYATGYMGDTNPIKADIDVDAGYSVGVSAKYDDETGSVEVSIGLGPCEITGSIGLN